MNRLFFTIHDASGNRIDDDSDNPFLESELAHELMNFQPLLIDGEKFWSSRIGGGEVLIVQVATLPE